MALMGKMSLNQATGIGDGKLGKRIKKKAKEVKRNVKIKLSNLGDDIRRGVRNLKSNVANNREERQDNRQANRQERQANRQERQFNREINRGVRKENRQDTRVEKLKKSNKGAFTGSTGIKKLDSYSTKINKYSNPGLYKVVKAVRNIGDSFDQMGMKIKQNKGRRRAMQDAAGPTKRNKDVMVCKEGQCQTR